ncbi:MAG: hypothetical protein M3162_01065 [Thermoproteota archaeon]|nr:hypothetical protein [Thermoproteota archaeon]
MEIYFQENLEISRYINRRGYSEYAQLVTRPEERVLRDKRYTLTCPIKGNPMLEIKTKVKGSIKRQNQKKKDIRICILCS